MLMIADYRNTFQFLISVCDARSWCHHVALAFRSLASFGSFLFPALGDYYSPLAIIIIVIHFSSDPAQRERAGERKRDR